jgi:hypothetical protein
MLQATSETCKAVIEDPASVVVVGMIGFDTGVLELFAEVDLLDVVDVVHDRRGSQGNDGVIRVEGNNDRGRHRNVKG